MSLLLVIIRYLLGRNAYTPEEDTAILNYVTKRKEEIGGNQLWKQMEQERVTSHTWQSMKYRYRARLSKQLEVEEVETSKEETKETEEETKVIYLEGVASYLLMCFCITF